MENVAIAILPGLLAVLALAAFIKTYLKLQLERKEHENTNLKLANAEERYKILTDNLAASIIIRAPGGRVIYCSPFTEVATGYSLKEIYAAEGDFFESTVHEDDKEKYKRSLKVSTFGEAFQFRYRFYHKSGILMWAESRTVPIMGSDGTAISTLSITLDVTGTVRHQKQIEEKNRELQDFTYMVSHDLKAPIFTIKGMLSILQQDFKDQLSVDAQEPITHLTRATNRLEQLVTSVLEYSRATTLEVKEESVDLFEIIDEVIKDYSHQLANLNCTVNFDKTLPRVQGDRLKLVQVFSNLLSNAIKYRSSDRPLKVDIFNVPTPTLRSVRIAFRDNGIGVPQSQLEAIFRPFQRLHGQDIEGSGIGLACVKKLLEKMGGDVSVESDGHTGSTFNLTLRHGH